MSNFFEQKLVKINIGKYELDIPEAHMLIELVKTQPYRDLCVGISAKFFSENYPDSMIVDIGANIGDTAAIISTYCQNKLLLIEASDYYHEILMRNTPQLSNELIIKKILISDGSESSGLLYHWGGTAYFKEEEKGVNIKTERLCDVADDNTCLVKIDTDGYDFKIILDSINWLEKVKPGVLFENEIRNTESFENSNQVYHKLIEIGYKYFIVWDDPGFHMVSTSSLDILKNLNRYLFKVWEREGYKTICNYDILCIHQDDEDIYKKLCEW